MEFNEILNDDVMIRIVRHLPIEHILKQNIATVSQQFNRVVNQSLKSVKVIDRYAIFGDNKNSVFITSSSMAYIIRKCSNVKHISLNHMNVVKSSRDDYIVMESIIQYCHRLESIDFYLLNINEYFQRFARVFPQIKMIASKKLNDESLDCIIESPFLETIDLSYNNYITGSTFNRFGENISELMLYSRQKITGKVINQLIHGNVNGIKKLSIYIKLDQQFALICNRFTQLTYLNLRFSDSITNLQKISQLTRLTHLSLEAKNKSEFTVHQIRILIESVSHGENIREFQVCFDSSQLNSDQRITPYLSNNSIVELLCNIFPNLVKLKLNKLTDVIDGPISSIARLKHLTHLSLTQCSDFRNGIKEVIKTCPLLQHLNLQSCDGITDEVLHASVEKCDANCKHILVLDIRETGLKIDVNDRRHWLSNLQLYADYV